LRSKVINPLNQSELQKDHYLHLFSIAKMLGKISSWKILN